MIKEDVKPKCIYTEQELMKLVPHFRVHLLENKNVRKHMIAMFHRLGCVFEDGYEIQKGLTTRNRFNEADTSPRIILNERTDEEYTMSKHASDDAKVSTNDVGMMQMIDKHRNQRCFYVED